MTTMMAVTTKLGVGSRASVQIRRAAAAMSIAETIMSVSVPIGRKY
jgi:hypothetical protein